MCKDCRRQFVANLTNHRISNKTKQTINDLLRERISLAGIVRFTKVSLAGYRIICILSIIAVLSPLVAQPGGFVQQSARRVKVWIRG